MLVNTCGFIEQSQQESINAVLGLAAGERRRRRSSPPAVWLRSIAMTGAQLTEVDAFFDPGEWDAAVATVAAYGLRPGVDPAALAEAAERVLAGAPVADTLTPFYAPHLLRDLERRASVALPPAPLAAPFDIPAAGPTGAGRVSAYLKISDGCNAPCTFCIIPQIKGRFTSADAGDLLAQARQLRAEGARELVLVAQDSTAYGEDLGCVTPCPACYAGWPRPYLMCGCG
ncbi:MAG: hypothetical protein U0531_08780 [Dehalococcoidia bacterium]